MPQAFILHPTDPTARISNNEQVRRFAVGSDLPGQAQDPHPERQALSHSRVGSQGESSWGGAPGREVRAGQETWEGDVSMGGKYSGIQCASETHGSAGASSS